LYEAPKAAEIGYAVLERGRIGVGCFLPRYRELVRAEQEEQAWIVFIPGYVLVFWHTRLSCRFAWPSSIGPSSLASSGDSAALLTVLPPGRCCSDGLAAGLSGSLAFPGPFSKSLQRFYCTLQHLYHICSVSVYLFLFSGFLLAWHGSCGCYSTHRRPVLI
jgi:hypothetical protein